MGNIVTAKVKLLSHEPLEAFRKRMWIFCQDKLPRFKIPQKVMIVTEAMHGERFKKLRV
jgi:hypothetical protein